MTTPVTTDLDRKVENGRLPSPWGPYRDLGFIARRFTGGRPHLIVVTATLAIFALAYSLSFLLRFEFSIPEWYSVLMTHTVPIIVLIKVIVFYVNGIYR